MIFWLGLALAAPVRLDFGGEHTPGFDGFDRATPWSLADPRASWRTPATRATDVAWPDPLLADGVTDGVLHLDLPPGTYSLAALFDEVSFGLKPAPGRRAGVVIDGVERMVAATPSGADFFASAWHARDPRPRFGPGRGPWDRQIGPIARWRVEQVQVGPQGLTVAPLGAPLAALIVAPVPAADLEVEVALIDAQRRAWYERHRPARPDAELPLATQGLAGWEPLEPGALPTLDFAERWSPGHNTTLPYPSDLTLHDPLQLTLAPGEQHVAYLALHGSDAPADVALERTLPGATLFEVDWLDVQEARQISPEPYVLRPLDGALLAAQGLTPIVALRLQIPADAAPGRHVARLRATRGETTLILPIELRVRHLTLERPVAPLGVWADLRSVVAAVHGPDSPEARAIWGRDVALLRSFQFERLNLRGLYFPGGWPGIGYEPPEERARWALDAWREAGGGPAAWVDPSFFFGRQLDLAPTRPALPEAARETAARMLRFGIDHDFEIYVFDEVATLRGSGVLDAYGRLLDDLDSLPDRGDLDEGAAQGDPPRKRARIAVADPNPGAWPTAADRTDTIYLQHAPFLDPAMAAWFDGRRAEPLTYTALFRREAVGRLGWLLGTRAITFWHYNEPRDDPYNDTYPRPQWQLALLAPDGQTPLPTTRLVRLNQGLQDQRYLVTLSALVHELAGHRRRAVRDQVAHACELLAVAAHGIAGRLPNSHPRRGLSDDRALEDLRLLTGDAAERLARHSKRQRAHRRGTAEPIADATGRWPEACGPAPSLPDAWRSPP